MCGFGLSNIKRDMRLSDQLPLSAAKENLRRLVTIRAIGVLVQIAGVYFAYGYLDAMLRYDLLALVISVMILAVILTVFRLRLDWPVTDVEYFLQLSADVTALTLLLYFAGGSTNPFISYYLVLLTISAATLPWSYTWLMAGFTIGAYSLLVFFYHPLIPVAAMEQAHGMPQQSFFNLHILGMWITFVASALLITFFVVKMARAIREQDAVLAEGRETVLHDEQLLAVATLAAGAAHELSTPLSTMAVLVRELQQDNQGNDELRQDLQLLDTQLQACKHSLQAMVDKSETSMLNRDESFAAVDYVDSLMQRWRLLRPEVHSDFEVITGGNQPRLAVDETMSQAILNLLNNAGDASPEKVEIRLAWDSERLLLTIRDFGSGIPMAMAEKIGKPFVSTKRKGLGLGLFLSHATVARFNGQVALYNHDEGGTLTEISLPINWGSSDR